MKKIEFKVNYKKTLEAILYILNSRPRVNMYNLLKVVFEADKIHLNQAGRPVTGDTYLKLEHGTVPHTVYNEFFKFDEIALQIAGEDAFPYRKVAPYYYEATRQADLDYLSKSDIRALNQGIEKYIDLPFGEVRELNHEERCWIESTLNCEIDFRKMIDNPEVLEELEENPLPVAI